MLGVAAALCALAAAVPPQAGASGSWPRCEAGSDLRCKELRVPLDRSGKVPGTVKLHVERLAASDLPEKPVAGAAGTKKRGAIVALAGGPGQPATLFTSDFIFAFGDRAAGRDVVAFDQRGTGRSGLLRCPSVEKVTLLSRYPAAGEECAQRLGDRRGLYRTSDSVEDLEAVRQALGVDKIAIYGASYGTKVALAYAAAYPTHVERLILDSVLPLDGPDPFYGDSLAAMGRVQRDSCSGGCKFTKDPAADLLTLGSALLAHPARGYVVDSRGRRQDAAIGSTRLFYLLLSGDFSPELRAALPGAIHSAAGGDPAQLLRLAALNEATGEPSPPSEFAAGVYAATICEEAPLPWQRGAPFDGRPGAAIDAADARGAAAFAPLGAGAVLETDVLALCERWPEASPAPAAPGPLPDVPTLILEGALDLRTPLESAQRVAQQLPHSTTVKVPSTGHSTLGSDVSDCTLTAITRFLLGRTPRSTCADPPPPLVVTEPVPESVDAVDPMKGAPKSVARMLAAVALTLDDVEDQAANQAIIAFTNDDTGPVRGGGLRGGHFRNGASGLSVDTVTFIKGLRVSGRLLNRATRIGTFRISLGGKRGSVAYRGGGLITGRFDGRRFRVKLRRNDSTPPSISLGKPVPQDRPKPVVR